MSDREGKEDTDGGSGRAAGGGYTTDFDGRRETNTSAISPSLDEILRGDENSSPRSEASSSVASDKKSKNKIRREKKEKKAKELFDSELEVNRKQIQELEEQLAAMKQEQPKLNASRRQSVADVAKSNASGMVQTLQMVSESDKLKKVNAFTIIGLEQKLQEMAIQGVPTCWLAYLSQSAKQALLLWLASGEATEAGLNGKDFTDVTCLERLTDDDIKNCLILSIRCKERHQLLVVMRSINSYSSTSVNRPVYLQLKTVIQAVLEYLFKYERIYKMLSGEVALEVNGVMIGLNPHVALDTVPRSVYDVTNPETHDGIIKEALVKNGLLTKRLYAYLKSNPEDGLARQVVRTNYLLDLNSQKSKLDSNHVAVANGIKKEHDSHVRLSFLCDIEGKKSEPNKRLLDVLRKNCLLLTTIYEGVVKPYLSTVIEVDTKSTEGKMASILVLDDDELREDIIQEITRENDPTFTTEYVNSLECELKTVKQQSADHEARYNELIAEDNSSRFQAVHGAAPVKIPTGFQHNSHKAPVQVIPRPKPDKPCFAEARTPGSCTFGAQCRYSHNYRDLETLRRDPDAMKKLHTLGSLEDIPQAYDAAALAFSEQY